MERKINCKQKNQKNPQILLLGPSITAEKNNRNSQITVAEEDFIVEGDYNHHNTQAIVMEEGLNHHNTQTIVMGEGFNHHNTLAIVMGEGLNHHNTQAIVMGEGLNHHNSKIMGVGDDLKLQALTTIQIHH